MRVHLTILVLAAGLLAACGRGGNDARQNAVAAAPAPPAPAAPTEARKKAVLASLPAAYQGADFDNGQAKFALCKSCHTALQGGADMTGPNLFGVFGRVAGTRPGFAYSDALKASRITWNAASLDKWIANPRADVAGTKMTYLGMENPRDRIDLIAYLELATMADGG
ncbi:MAG: c-type cytochrome [Caulobacteraceae bacterium]